MRAIWIFIILLIPIPAFAFCFKEAGERQEVDYLLLEAMAIQESGLRQYAINQNRDKSGKVVSTDYGVMQINTGNAKKLIAMGLIRSTDDLLRDACFNVQAGAWVLARHLKVCGNTWRCLGSYNAGFHPSAEQEAKRLKYAQDVRDIYNRLKARGDKPTNIAIR